jgi:hypothetical protein
MDHVPLGYSIADATRVSSISRASLYRLAARGDIEMVRVGRRTIVTAASLTRLLHAAPSPEQEA